MAHPSASASLAGRRVLITGASSGIGLACARLLSEAGASVVLVARGEEALRRAAGTMDPEPLVISADVTDADAVLAAVHSGAQALGGLDAVVVNAGAGAYGPFRDMRPDDYRRTIDVTLTGAANTAHAALPELERTGGTLVFVGSIAGRVPTPWLSAYAAAKHGVRGFARSLSTELQALRSSVRIALVAPGPVDTPFWQRARTTDGRQPPKVRGAYRAEDVARAVARALADPRAERSVGGLMALWVFADAIAPSVSVRATGVVARLGWRRRENQPAGSPVDGLAEPVHEPEVGGGLPSRPSLLGALRDRIGARR